MPGLSVYLPLTKDEQDGVKLNKTYQDMIRQNLKNLILTCPGERVMIPEFGVGLRNFLFEPMTNNTQTRITSKIHDQISKYLPFISIINIKYEQSNNFLNLLKMTILYRVDPLETSDILKLESDSNSLNIIDTTNT